MARVRTAVGKCLLASLLILFHASVLARTTLLVPIDKDPSWRDLAFLAAVPAICAANSGRPSLIAMDRAGTIVTEIADYLRRYKPDRVYALCSEDQAATLNSRTELKALVAEGLDKSASMLSRTFWKSSRLAVICLDDDYDSALIGSSIASLLKAPLLFSASDGLSSSTKDELKRLGANEIVFVGSVPPPSIKPSATLEGPVQAMLWASKRKLPIRYLAAVNPLDRSNYVTRKLSLVGAVLAAGRRGMVAPLKFDVKWKQPFETSVFTGPLPQGVPASTAPAKSGTIEIGSKNYPFFLTGSPKEENLRLSIDIEGNGRYSGPFASGDQIDLAGKRWSVSLGSRTKFGKTDVHLTWPTAERLCQELRTYYRALGRPPTWLCLVGFPDALPQAIIGRGGVVEEQASDLPYSFGVDGKFATIGVGRVVAEDAVYGTLYASRVLTYSDLVSKDWADAACQADWENAYQPMLENYGYSAAYRHTKDALPWLTPPADGKEGKRASSFGPESPLARCALLIHADHSWWRGLGSTVTWDSETLMAPTIVESGGCGTACLDREPDNRSVVARLLRLGAVAFAGATREQSAQAQPVRDMFWNGVLAGESIGQAHMRALNFQLLTVYDRKEGPDGGFVYNAHIRMLFGDPALSIRPPSKPKAAPARTILSGNRVTVLAPEKWWIVKLFVPPDWKAWADKDLYVLRGPGTYATSEWCEKGYNFEVETVPVEFTVRKRVKAIEQVQSPSAPLGWTGAWHEQKNADGTFTYRFAVRMVDFDEVRGKILRSVDRLDYQIRFE